MNIVLRLSILLCVGWFVSCVGAGQQTQSMSRSSSAKNTIRKHNKRRVGYHCTYKYSRWRPFGLTLRPRPGEPVFARMIPPYRGIRTFIRLSDRGPDKGAFVRLSALGITIWGTSVNPVGFRIYMNRPTMFGPTVIASQSASVKWRGYSGKRVTVELQTGTSYQPTEALMAYVPCEHTSILYRFTKDLRDATELPPGEKKVWLKKKTRIPVSAVMGGAVKGYLYLKHFSRAAEWLQEQDDFVKVYVPMYGYAVFGWIPKTALQTSPASQGSGGLLGSLVGRRRGKKYIRRYICSEQTSLFLRNRQKVVRKIGFIKRRIPFEIIQKGPKWTQIRFHGLENWARLTRTYQWVIPTVFLPACHLMGAMPA